MYTGRKVFVSARSIWRVFLPSASVEGDSVGEGDQEARAMLMPMPGSHGEGWGQNGKDRQQSSLHQHEPSYEAVFEKVRVLGVMGTHPHDYIAR